MDIEMLLFLFPLLFIIIFIIGIVGVIIQKRQMNQLKQYWNVRIGMTEYEMLSIMGEGYNRSLLKNNRTKYEWRINGTSYSSYYRGISVRSYSGVKKVAIYTRDGYVEEVKPYNV